MLNAQEILGIAVSFLGGGSLIGVANLIANRRKTAAEVQLTQANKESILSGAALDFVRELRADVTELRQQASDQQKNAETLSRKVQILGDHVKLQMEMIMRFREALKGYDPDHPLLKEVLAEPQL